MTDSRRIGVIFAILGVYLAVSAVPVTAASATLAVGSEHSDDAELGNGTLTNTTITGSGENAFVEFSHGVRTYSVVDDEGDGTAENERTLMGDSGSGTVFKRGLWLQPDTSGEMQNVTVNIASTKGSDYGFVVDVYVVPEKPDGTFGEGTLVRDNYDPAFATGPQTIEFNTSITVEKGANYTVAFETQSGDGDSTSDWLTIGTDEDSGLTGPWMETESGNTEAWPGDITAKLSHQPDSGRYLSPNHSVAQPVESWANLTLSNTSVTIEWQAWNSSGGQWQVVNSSQFSSTGNYTLDISGTGYDKWRVNVSFNKTDSNPTAELHDEGILFDPTRPTVNNSSASPKSGETISKENVELSLPVNDSDFGTAQGDTVDVSFYLDNSQVDVKTISSNQTVSTTVSGLDGGSHDWHVIAESTDYDEPSTQSDTFSFESPDTIYIRNETSPDQLINNSNVSVEVTFYGENQTIVRETSTGKVDMTGIPTNQEFVVVAQSDGFYQRRVIVDSLVDQQNIFLLNESTAAISNSFLLDDQTGQYPSKETRLYVQASLNLSSDSNPRWYTIGGDYFGAAESYPITLEKGGRYRLVVETDSAPRRELGAYIASESGDVPVSIGEVVFDIGGGNDTYKWRANYTEVENDSDYIEFQYSDAQNDTTNFGLTIYNQSNPDDVLYSTTDDRLGNLSTLLFLNASEENTTWVVSWTADRGGSQIAGDRTLGAVKEPVDLNVDPMHQKLLVGLLVVFVAGMFSGPFSRTGGVVVAGVGAGLWAIDWLPIPIEYVLAAIAIGVMGKMAHAGGVSSR
jgi:hypothetical protein